MSYSSIVREMYVEAVPEVVYDVVSRPEHVAKWWTDDAEFEPIEQTTGRLIFGARNDRHRVVHAMTIVRADPPHLFSFRWSEPGVDRAAPGNSLLVTFEISPAATGSVLRMTETDFQEEGLPGGEVEDLYRSHVAGWNHYLPLLSTYAAARSAR